MECLDSLPESNITVVYHHNIKQRFWGYTIDNVPNEWPILFAMRDRNKVSLYLRLDGNGASKDQSNLEMGKYGNDDGLKNLDAIRTTHLEHEVNLESYY